MLCAVQPHTPAEIKTGLSGSALAHAALESGVALQAPVVSQYGVAPLQTPAGALVQGWHSWLTLESQNGVLPLQGWVLHSTQAPLAAQTPVQLVSLHVHTCEMQVAPLPQSAQDALAPQALFAVPSAQAPVAVSQQPLLQPFPPLAASQRAGQTPLTPQVNSPEHAVVATHWPALQQPLLHACDESQPSWPHLPAAQASCALQSLAEVHCVPLPKLALQIDATQNKPAPQSVVTLHTPPAPPLLAQANKGKRRSAQKVFFTRRPCQQVSHRPALFAIFAEKSGARKSSQA